MWIIGVEHGKNAFADREPGALGARGFVREQAARPLKPAVRHVRLGTKRG